MDRDKEKDIERIKVLHGLKSNFHVSDALHKDLINQFNNEKNAKEISRFFRGFDAEDIFRYVFSALPWTKLLIKLGQEQLPTFSKEEYQVPDFLIYIEDNKKLDVPIFIEVKSINQDKMKLEIMDKQIEGLLKFSKVQQIPLIFAIYWRKQNNWIITTIDYFVKKKKQYQINVLDALKNDISIFLANDCLLFPPNIILKTKYTKEKKDAFQISHKKHGFLISSEVSFDGINFVEIENYECAILDSFIDFKEFKIIDEDNYRVVLEKSKYLYTPRFSHLIMSYIKKFSAEVNFDHCLFSVHTILELMNKVNINKLKLLPSMRSKTTDDIFKKAFEGSDIYRKYLQLPFKN